MKRLLKPLLGLGITFCGSLALQTALAEGPVNPLLPGVSVGGAFIDQNVGWADIMVPVFRPSPTSFLYFDPQTLYHNNDQYTASLGGGFRILTPASGILGAYVFGDYDHSSNNNTYWFVSPGIERLGDILDFSVNGYFPINTRRNNTSTGFASEFGDTDSVFFSGHSEFDEIVQNFESVGPGVDGLIGYRLPFLRNNTKLYLGGYYFSPKDTNNIGGGIAKLDIPANNWLSITVSDAYDNQFHNTFRLGASLSLWGRSTHYYDHTIETRLVDPIQRNLISQEGPSATGQYIAQGQENLEPALLLSNLWFFAPGGTFAPTAALSNCTAEHPCATQDVNSDFFGGINAIAPNANMFLAPGTYNNLASASTFGGILDLNPGQSMFGRTANFKQAATGNTRPLLIGRVNMPSNTLLDSLRLGNDGSESVAVLVLDNSSNVRLNNDIIGNLGTNLGQTYETGVQIGNTIGKTSVSISKSEIDVFNSATPGDAISAISAPTTIGGRSDNNNVSIDNSILQASNVDGGFTVSTRAVLNNGLGNSWRLTNNRINVSGSFPRVFDDQNDPGNSNWYLKNNNVLASSDEGIAMMNEAGGHNSTWTLIDNSMRAVCSGGNGIDMLFDGGGLNKFNLTGNTLIAEETGGGTAIIVHDNGFFGNDVWTLTDNTLIAFSRGSVVGFDMTGSNGASVTADIINLTGNAISISGSGIVAKAFDDASKGANLWQLSSNEVSVNTTFGNAWGIHDESRGQNNWILSNNAFQVGASAAAGNAYGIEDNATTNPNHWILTSNAFTVSTAAAGAGGDAFGFLIGNTGDTINSTRDAFNITATGVNANAYGFASNVDGVTATGAVININGDVIYAASAQNNAFGVFDSTGNNTWVPSNNGPQIIANNHIAVNGANGAPPSCKVSINGICSN